LTVSQKAGFGPFFDSCDQGQVSGVEIDEKRLTKAGGYEGQSL